MRKLHAHRNADDLACHRLDWLKAAIIGLSDHELAILKDIADIDGRTANHMRQVIETEVPVHSVSKTFLTLWNDDEFRNCQDMAKLFTCCGLDLAEERAKDPRGQRQAVQWLARGLLRVVARLAPRTATALQLSWSASQKFMLAQSYQRLASTTTNPILRVICLRIARQERRNFHWYFSGARAILLRASGSRAAVRLLLRRAWYPLRSKSRSKKRAQQTLALLFPGARLSEAMNNLDEAMTQLPGLSATDFAARFAAESPRHTGLRVQSLGTCAVWREQRA